jgi:hypothetical protein
MGVAAVEDSAPGLSLRTSMGDATVEDDNRTRAKPRLAAIAATTSRPGTRILGTRRVVVRAGAW